MGVGAAGFEPAKAIANRFTVCPLWPLGYTPAKDPGYGPGWNHIPNHGIRQTNSERVVRVPDGRDTRRYGSDALEGGGA